jgi:uncharacterized membrane protein
MLCRKLWLVPLIFFLSFKLVSAYPLSDDIYLYGTLFTILLILLVLGYFLRSYFYHIIAGFLFVVVGVYTFINGAGYDQTWFEPTNASIVGTVAPSLVGNGWIFYCSFILLGLGLYYVLAIAYQNVWGNKEIEE